MNDWSEIELLDCPIKTMTGVDCPGCGIQRAFVLLMRGEWAESFAMYPALLPILFLFGFLVLHLIFNFKYGAKVLQWTYIFVILIVLGNWLIKLQV